MLSVKHNPSQAADTSQLRTIKDVTKALQNQFTGAKIPLSLPSESRRTLQDFVEEFERDDDGESSARINAELKSFWHRYVGESPQRLGPFVGVLKELQPAIEGTSNGKM